MAQADTQGTQRNTRRRRLLLRGLLVLVGVIALGAWLYPTGRTPKSAYYRVAAAVNGGSNKRIFRSIELRAQHASFTIQSYHRKSYELVERDFPEPARTQTLARLAPMAQARDGVEVFALYAERHGWVARLRHDLSGIASIEIQGERATVATLLGTRYPFRRGEDGIWGLTLFTARLVADAEKAARDHAMIEAAASDYRAASLRGEVPKP